MNSAKISHLFLELLTATILLHLSDLEVRLVLQLKSHLKIVLPCIDIVQIVMALDFVDTAASQLHQGQEDGNVSCCSEEISILVEEGRSLYADEQLTPERPQLRKFLLDVSVQILLLLLVRILSREAADHTEPRMVCIEIRVNNPSS
jgi:hypothetical protein